MTADRTYLVDVFPAADGGGNPAPVVVPADDLDDAQMQGIARDYGHESAFVLTPPAGSGCDAALRFWVPNHEMSMCGHATVGAVWLLDRLGLLDGRDHARVWTASGPVEAVIRGDGAGGRAVEVSQPAGRVSPVAAADVEAVLDVLGLEAADLADAPVENAATSRVKTLVPLADEARLHALAPRSGGIEALCERLDSTGLYPYAPVEGRPGTFQARQFPRAAGYPEDAATGIAATALASALLARGVVGPAEPVVVRQGWAMGRPSEITVRFRVAGGDVVGCWLGGPVRPRARP